MGVRERTQSKRKPTQRKMKIPLVLLVACVASLKAASLMDVTECPAECCPTTTNAPTTTADPTPTAGPTDDPVATDAPVTTDEPVTTDAPVTTDEPVTTPEPATTNAEREATGDTTTANICDICDQSTCEQGEESGPGAASLSLLALLLPAVFARLL